MEVKQSWVARGRGHDARKLAVPSETLTAQTQPMQEHGWQLACHDEYQQLHPMQQDRSTQGARSSWSEQFFRIGGEKPWARTKSTTLGFSYEAFRAIFPTPRTDRKHHKDKWEMPRALFDLSYLLKGLHANCAQSVFNACV